MVETEVIKGGLLNVTTSVVTCCKGYEKKHKGKCKSKFYFGINESSQESLEQSKTSNFLKGYFKDIKNETIVLTATKSWISLKIGIKAILTTTSVTYAA